MGKNILIVDDDRGILKSFKELLEPEGYSVDTAETAVEAVEKCNARPYNLAIIDIKLRDVEGTDLLARVHEILPRARKNRGEGGRLGRISIRRYQTKQEQA